MRTLALLAVMLCTPALAATDSHIAESCSIVAGSPPTSIPVPGLSVVGLTETDTFSLPANLPDDVGAVVCTRASIVPAEFDYKVLQAGYPFAISVTEGGTLWLELRDGQLAVSFDEGALSDVEMAQTQEWLDKVQPEFHKQEVPSE